MDTWKYFFETYSQFGHTPSKRFASPGIGSIDSSSRT